MDNKSELQYINIDLIKPNPENPRIIFRQEEMDALLVSIKKNGVQVPISVYKEGKNFVIIDGERRWRTCLKLNFPKIPAIIQDKPSQLENLLMMFNIHALREQWDLFTTANKLTNIIDLFRAKNNYYPTEAQLNEETGLSRTTIRRCKLIIDLPQRHKALLVEELQKPKAKQKLSEDFFIAMETSLKTTGKNLPEAISDINIVRDNLIKKFRVGVIKNMMDFRKVTKIATSPKKVDYSRTNAVNALRKIFGDNTHSIEDVFDTTVSPLYTERQTLSNFNSILTHITSLSTDEQHDDEVITALIEIRKAIDKILTN